MDSKHAIRSTAVVAALAFLAACQDTTTPSPSAPDLQRADARSEQAQERLAQLFPDASAEVLDLPGTVYADHNERTGKLEFGIERAEQARGVEARLRARGVRDGEYEIKVTAPITNMATLRDVNESSVQAGTQINFGGYVCTMGFNISAGSFITNSHCTNKQGGVESTDYWMPVRVGTAAPEAREVEDPTYTKLPGCSGGKMCRRSDASRAVYLSSATQGAANQIAAPTSINTGDLTIGTTLTVTSVSTADTFTGTVQKVGRTTGRTEGTVTNSCVNINVSGSRLQLQCQTLVTNNNAKIVEGGDSGSPVFRAVGGGYELVGLLWGGSGTSTFVFSPIKNVKAELTGY